MAYRRTERVLQRLAARHDAIIAAARDLAAADGLDAVQIAPVAARAGIAAGTMYRYFPAKSDLVAALIAGETARDLDVIRRAADAAPGPLSALAAAIVAWAARALRQRRLAWALTAGPAAPEVERLRIHYRRALAGEFEARIRAAAAGGHLPEQDHALAAAALIGALVEALVGPLAATGAEGAKARDRVQAVTLIGLRSLGVIDARARGLVVQAAWPREDAA